MTRGHWIFGEIPREVFDGLQKKSWKGTLTEFLLGSLDLSYAAINNRQNHMADTVDGKQNFPTCVVQNKPARPLKCYGVLEGILAGR